MRFRVRLICVLVVCLLATGCGGVSDDRTVTVLASWTGSEESGFRAVLDEFTERTGITVNYQGTRALNEVLASDVQSGRPPDIGILFSPGLLAQYARTDELVPLREILGDEYASYSAGWQQFGEIGQPDVYAVPVKANLKNLVWYRTDRFPNVAQRTISELTQESRSFQSQGIDPWCLGMHSPPTSGWPGTDWIEDLLLQESGTDAYQQWASGRLPWNSAEVRQAWSVWGTLIGVPDADRSTSVGALFNDFDDAAKPMFRNGNGCVLDHQASFAMQVYSAFDQAPTPGKDFNFFTVSGSAGSSSVPIVSADLAALFNDTPEARELIRFLASPDGQQIWPRIPRSGAFSASSQVQPDVYGDNVSKRIADRLARSGAVCYDASDTMPVEMTVAFERSVLEYLADPQRLDALLDQLERVRTGINPTEWVNFQCVP